MDIYKIDHDINPQSAAPTPPRVFMQLSPNLVNTHKLCTDFLAVTLSNLCLGSQVEIKQPVEEEEKAASPKCIGPGCSSDSLPESVYCGHQCIVRHAAAAIKSLSEPKIETKPAAPPADPPLKVNIILVSFISCISIHLF